MSRFVALAFFFVIATAASIASAQPCLGSGDCQTGFCVDDVCCDIVCDTDCMSCSTILKGGGVDGECGPSVSGTECSLGGCDGPTFSHVPADVCDGAGSCVDGGPPISCYSDTFELGCGADLCGDQGCEVVTFQDGTSCADDLVCNDGLCDTPAEGGAPGSGGDEGGFSSSGGAGQGGDGGGGPPAEIDSGCGCELPGHQRPSGAAWLLLLWATVIWRRRS
jgi:hypothetical protein